MSLAGRLRAWWRGADDAVGLPAVWGPAAETFAVRRLYERYGHDIYARAAADPAFSEAIAALVAEIRQTQRDEPRAKRLDKGQALNAYLLGYAHALLMELLDAAVRTDDGPGGPSSPADDGMDDGTWAAIRLGAMFQLAFDGGLLKLPAAPDAS